MNKNAHRHLRRLPTTILNIFETTADEMRPGLLYGKCFHKGYVIFVSFGKDMKNVKTESMEYLVFKQFWENAWQTNTEKSIFY